MPHLRHIGVALILLLALTPARAQEYGGVPETIALWPEDVPEAVGSRDADRPMLTVYLPSERNATGAAVVVCPGGGYGHLAMDHEGHEVAEWLNTLGVTAVVLKYRLGMRYHYPAQLQDVQRAIRTVRAHADVWPVDPKRVGVLGFSAGGHLASMASTQYDAEVYEPRDSVDALSARPDFATLVYPVVSLTAPYAHTGSRRHLLGENPPQELVELLSSERQVTDGAPPTFLVHASDDPVSVKNSVDYYRALLDAGVPAELHVYETGGHGYGLAPGDPVLSSWPNRWEGWMRKRGMLGN